MEQRFGTSDKCESEEINIINRIISQLSKSDAFLKRYASTIEEMKDRLSLCKRKKYIIGIIGVTSSGKSTMINSLIGEALLPAKTKPSSSQLVSCCRGERKAEVHFKNGSSKCYVGKEVTSKIIEKYGDEEFNNQNKENVKQIVISTPNFALPDNVMLIDSPGLDAYGLDGHEKLTMESMLPTVDCCVFVTTCKTNSDDKMREVLDVVAEYDKPVVIVQNMIDSIQPSPDGKKTVVDIAQEHKVRVERIVTHSKIVDKSSVKIVQISAMLALSALTNGVRTEKDKINFNDSNFSILVKTICNSLDRIKPLVIEKRNQLLKQRLKEIISEAKKDGSGVTTQMKFQFQGKELELTMKLIQTSLDIDSKLCEFESIKAEIDEKYYFNDSIVATVKTKVSGIEEKLRQLMKSFHKYVADLCQGLNIDARDVMTPTSFNFTSSFDLKTKPKYKTIHHEEKQSGFWGSIKRCLDAITPGHGNWGYDEWDKKVPDGTEPDNEATKKSALTYVSNAKSAFQMTSNSWLRRADEIKDKITNSIKIREKEFNDRKNKALEKQQYLELAKDLENISNSIVVSKRLQTEVKNETTDVRSKTIYKVEVSKSTYKLSQVANNLRTLISSSIMKMISDSKLDNYVIGWDVLSEILWVNNAFNKKILDNSVKEGLNDYENIHILHHPSQRLFLDKTKRKNIFLLVNATQYGAARKQIASSGIKSFLNMEDNMFFVVQDFQEIIIANDVENSIDNMIELQNDFPNIHSKILFNHENPIYNLAALEIQTKKNKLFVDSVETIRVLQEKFRYLFSDKANQTKILNSIINKLENK